MKVCSSACKALFYTVVPQWTYPFTSSWIYGLFQLISASLCTQTLFFLLDVCIKFGLKHISKVFYKLYQFILILSLVKVSISLKSFHHWVLIFSLLNKKPFVCILFTDQYILLLSVINKEASIEHLLKVNSVIDTQNLNNFPKYYFEMINSY